ncbi:MAG: type II toxin-antitoxin system RelE/ParE family toxin [Rhizomicrobium sp.]
MLEVRQTAAFTNWLARLADRNAQARIVARLRRFEIGNLGDVKPVGAGVMEARIDYGPGYRLYFVQHGNVLIVMLCGGDKRTQKTDIERARKLAKEI